MRSQTIIILFLVTLVGLPVFASVIANAETGVITQLNFVDSTYDAVPGYRIPVTLHAEGERNVIQYGFAAAAIKVADLEVGFTADPPSWGGLGGMDVYFYVKKGTSYVIKEKIDSIGYNGGKHGYDAVITITVDCNGKITIHTDYGDVTSQISNYQSCTPIDIYQQTGRVDSTTIHLASNVRYGDPTQLTDCGCNTGNLPQPGTGGGGNTIGGDNNDTNPIDINKIAMYGLGAVAVLGALAILASRR